MDATLPPKHRKKGSLPPWVVILTLLLLVGGAYGSWHVLNQPKDGVRLDAVKAELREKLPAGAPKENITKWFDAKGYTTYGESKDLSGQANGYRALVQNDTYLEKAEIEISCVFDADGKVTTADAVRIKVRP